MNDGTADAVFKYTVAGGLLGSWTIDTANASPTGITLDPTGASQSLWIVDNGSDRVYEYTAARSRISGSQSAVATFALAAGNTNPQGIADPPPAADRVDQQGTFSAPRPASAEPQSAGVWWLPSDAFVLTNTPAGAISGGYQDRVSSPARATASFDDIHINAAATAILDRAGDKMLHPITTMKGPEFGLPAWWDEALFVPRMVPVDADAMLELQW